MRKFPLKKLKALKVTKGAGRGKKIGVPTINFVVEQVDDLDEGIYLCRVYLPQSFWGLLHFGPRPTFGESKKTLEVYLLDFSGDVSIPLNLDIEVLDYIRGIIKFESPESMVLAIEKDVSDAKRLIDKL